MTAPRASVQMMITGPDSDGLFWLSLTDGKRHVAINLGGDHSDLSLEFLNALSGFDGHWSDCAIHNEPAYPAGPCDCGAGGT